MNNCTKLLICIKTPAEDVTGCVVEELLSHRQFPFSAENTLPVCPLQEYHMISCSLTSCHTLKAELSSSCSEPDSSSASPPCWCQC